VNSRQIIDILLEQQILQPFQADDVLQEVTLNGKAIDQALIDSGFVNEGGFYQIMADALGIEMIDLATIEIAPEIVGLIPADLARRHEALPIDLSNNVLTIALVDPLAFRAIEDLRFAIETEIRQVIAPKGQVENLINRYYGAESSSMEEILAQLEDGGSTIKLEGDQENNAALEAEANATPIIRLVDLILFQAIEAHASDIHFEPFEDEFTIRYRVDGVLCEMAPPPRHLALPVISRVKVMANLNIAERRLPQDGRLQKKIADRTVDLRVSTLPTQFGESVVIRVLDRSTVNLDLEHLGLPCHIHDAIVEIIHRPNGIFIVTGPTGSGKTTTLYSCLKKLNCIDSKLLTVEEPVEYDLEGVVQVPVNETIGLTFARALRAFVRQDPDCIMVGETRDSETAQVSIQASLTGHLVLTTLHTNDAIGAISRLIDLGVEPFLIASALEAVLGQRLLRRICQRCRTPCQPNETLLTQLGLTRSEIGHNEFYCGTGCETCDYTGYHGRKGIYELLVITDPVRELINERAPATELKTLATQLGMTNLRQEGLRSVFKGETTIEEVLKYIWGT
jgi:type IV pilus assembly protein PilB